MSEETKLKKSKAMKGKKRSKEHCKNMSLAHKGNKMSAETKLKMSEAHRGKKHSEEVKKKMRIARIKNLQTNNGWKEPSYNKKACEFFKSFDEKNNTKGRYAIYGGGEYLIKELGYFPDYINFEKKIIIEWDENHHEKQIKKDIQRQQEIQKFYPDFEFLRINEEKIMKNKNIKEKKYVTFI